MKKKEAIENLNDIREKFLQSYGEDTVIKVPIDGDDMQALDMAIEALQTDNYFWEKCPYYEPDIMFDGEEEYDCGKCTYKTEPCDVAINKHEVLAQINCWIGSGEYRYTNATDYLVKRIYKLSPVKPSYNSIKTELDYCDDCISRKQALYELEQDQYHDEFCEEHHIDRSINMGMVKIRLNELPSVNPQKSGWIPVSERLPEKNMVCLVAVGEFNLTQMAMYSDLMGTIDHKIFYQGDYGKENFANITQYVKAWMPLPKPYKVESEE